MQFLLMFLLLFLGCDDDPVSPDEEFTVNIFSENTNTEMMQFSHSLDLDQFSIEFWGFEEEFECEDTPSGYCIFSPDTTNIYKVSNELVFGVNCPLIYDDNYKTLSGYEVINLDWPDGTGEECHPLYLNNIQSTEGSFLSSDINLISSNSDINTIPNPYYSISAFNESEYQDRIRFSHLPTSCTINIYNGNGEIINTLYHEDEFDGNLWWDLKDINENNISSGIYFYEIINIASSDGEIDTIDEMIHQGSAIILMPLED